MREEAIRRHLEVRAATEALCAPLTVEDHMLQGMPDCSPPKWHLGHTTWFFETFVLAPEEDGFRPFHPRFGYLFNSYYEALGARQARPERGLLSRPSLDEVHAYRRAVDARVVALLERCDPATLSRTVPLLELGRHHEQQHQELILTDLKFAFSRNVLAPGRDAAPPPAGGDPGPGAWIRFEGGEVRIGAGEGFAFDNERPRHAVLLRPYRLWSRPVTCGEWLAFAEDGGYRRPELWLSDGWAWVQEQGITAPLYWERDGEGWTVFTLGGPRALDHDEPVTHVSFYESDAFARWRGARLPTEAEWEHAFAGREIPAEANLLESGRHHPRALQRPVPDLAQGYGDVWEWTSSAYAPYPGYHPPPGAVGEYNGKFMCNQLVLRGGSCATPRSHVRASYRNFFHPHQRWQFTGIRLASDAP